MFQQDSLLLKHQVVAGRLIEDGAERAALTRVFEQRLGEFRDVANVIDFFLRPESDFITGQVFVVDGGKSIP